METVPEPEAKSVPLPHNYVLREDGESWDAAVERVSDDADAILTYWAKTDYRLGGTLIMMDGHIDQGHAPHHRRAAPNVVTLTRHRDGCL